MPSATSPDFTLTAWIDESVIIGRGDSSGTYTLAAVIADHADCDILRGRLHDLTIRPGVRLHWRAESTKRRDLIASAAAGMNIAAIVTVGAPRDRSRQERARRCCLERLLYELDQFGVTQVWLESRQAVQDRRDMQLIDSARDKGLTSRRVEVSFARPVDEPMLWLPDAVAGAMSAAILGEERWRTAMSELVTSHQVTVR